MHKKKTIHISTGAGLLLVCCLGLYSADTQKKDAVIRFQDNCAAGGPVGISGTMKPGQCVWVFEAYEPSVWEKEWYEREISGKYRNQECEILSQKSEALRSRRLIEAVRGAVLQGKTIPQESIWLFSRMVYAKRCGPQLKDTGERRVQLIEPLVGLLRDPLTICPQPKTEKGKIALPFDFGEDAVQSKRHLLIGPAAPWTANPANATSWRIGGFEPWAMDTGKCSEPRSRQNILVDIGASLYGVWQGANSAVGAMWFVDRYQKRHRSFDRIISYEIEKHDPDDIYRNVPKEILPRYFYFNQGVEAAPNGRWNPWRMLQGMGATPNDYVAVKLDIDYPSIENPLIEQILANKQTGLLVDEVFFEHHVNVKAMWTYWKTQKDPKTLKDSYQLFQALRFKGVRMHGWP